MRSLLAKYSTQTQSDIFTCSGKISLLAWWLKLSHYRCSSPLRPHMHDNLCTTSQQSQNLGIKMLYGTAALNYQTRRFLSQQARRSLGGLCKTDITHEAQRCCSARLYYAHFLGAVNIRINCAKARRVRASVPCPDSGCHGSWVTDKPRGAGLDEVTEAKKTKGSFFLFFPFFPSFFLVSKLAWEGWTVARRETERGGDRPLWLLTPAHKSYF